MGIVNGGMESRTLRTRMSHIYIYIKFQKTLRCGKTSIVLGIGETRIL